MRAIAHHIAQSFLDSPSNRFHWFQFCMDQASTALLEELDCCRRIGLAPKISKRFFLAPTTTTHHPGTRHLQLGTLVQSVVRRLVPWSGFWSIQIKFNLQASLVTFSRQSRYADFNRLGSFCLYYGTMYYGTRNEWHLILRKPYDFPGL